MIICCTRQFHGHWMVNGHPLLWQILSFLVLPASLNTLNFGSNLTLFGLGPSSFGSYLIWSSLVIIAIENFMLHHCRCKANMRQFFLFLMSTNPPIFRTNSETFRKLGDVCPCSGLISALIVVVRWHRKHQRWSKMADCRQSHDGKSDSSLRY